MSTQEIEKVSSSSLQLDEDIEYHKKGWRLQKVLIACIFILIVFCALGLFGNGMLSTKKMEAGANKLEYERFGRYGGESKLVFDVAATDTSFKIVVPSTYLDYFKIESMAPEPAENSMVDNNLILTFNGSGSNKVTFYLVPVKVGSISATIQSDHTNFKLSHFIYP